MEFVKKTINCIRDLNDYDQREHIRKRIFSEKSHIQQHELLKCVNEYGKELELKKELSIKEDYKNKNMHRLFRIGDILFPKVKDLNIVSKIMIMTRDVEYTTHIAYIQYIIKEVEVYKILRKHLVRHFAGVGKYGYSEQRNTVDNWAYCIVIYHNGKQFYDNEPFAMIEPI